MKEDELYQRIFGDLDKPMDEKEVKFASPYEEVFADIYKIQSTYYDYFKENGYCFVGLVNRFQWDIERYANPFDDSEFDIYNMDDWIGWRIDGKFFCLGMIAQAGAGKTTISKNIIGQYHKQGYKILIISSKDDEFSMSVNRKGTGYRLHPYNRPDTLPVKSFVPNYVKDYIMSEKPKNYTTYKYYSHSIKDFRTPEIWQALGLTRVVADRICSLIGDGITSLSEIKNKLWKSNLAHQSIGPAMPKIDNLIGTNFLSAHTDPLPLYEEWEKNNIVAVNYFSQSGFFMSTDIARLVEMVKNIGTKYKKQGREQRMLIVFDDMQMYADPSDKENEYSIKSIKYCQYNGRSKGIDLILSFQDPDLVDKKILRGIQIFLVSHFAQPDVLSGILDFETIKVMKASEEQKGTIYDTDSFTKEWILKLEGKKWYRLIPEGCHYYHK